MEVLAVGHRYLNFRGKRTYYEKRVTDYFDSFSDPQILNVGLEGSFNAYSNDFWKTIRGRFGKRKVPYFHLEDEHPQNTLFELEYVLQGAIQRKKAQSGEAKVALFFRSEDPREKKLMGRLEPLLDRLRNAQPEISLETLEEWKNAVSVARSLEMVEHGENTGASHLVVGGFHARDIAHFRKDIPVRTLYRITLRDWRQRINDYHKHESLMDELRALLQ